MDISIETTNQEERTLLLSMFIDGELEVDRRNEVERKIESDPEWQKDFQQLSATEDRITKAVENNWHDEDFTTKVRSAIKDVPRPSRETAKADVSTSDIAESKQQSKSGNWGSMVFVLGAVVFIILLIVLFIQKLS